MSFLYALGRSSLSNTYFTKMALILWVVFHFLDSIIFSTQVLCTEVQFIKSLSLTRLLLSKKPLPNQGQAHLLLCFLQVFCTFSSYMYV